MFTALIVERMMENAHSATQANSKRRWLYPFTDSRALNRIARRLRPTWSLDATLARVEAVVQENDQSSSLLLRPNRHWRGHRAGQHCLLEIEINGVRQQRAFSISSSPAQRGQLRLTIKKARDRGVSAWVQDQIKRGDVVRIGPAAGEFVLPMPLPAKLALLGAGSGMTPIIAMLHQLAEQAWTGDVVLLQCHRDDGDVLFADEIQALGQRLPGLRWLRHVSDKAGRLGVDSLQQHITDLEQRHLMMCGPGELMDGIEGFYAENGWQDRLQRERFGRQTIRATSAHPDQLSMACNTSNRLISTGVGESLLESAERAGLTPAFGCRAGICRTCLCKKTAGTVRNLQTGRLSEQPEEWIQLCISSAHTDIEIEL